MQVEGFSKKKTKKPTEGTNPKELTVLNYRELNPCGFIIK